MGKGHRIVTQKAEARNKIRKWQKGVIGWIVNRLEAGNNIRNTVIDSVQNLLVLDSKVGSRYGVKLVRCHKSL